MKKQYIIQYDCADGRLLYHSRCKGDFFPQERRELADVFNGKKYAEREADKMLLQDKNFLVSYSIQEVCYEQSRS